MANRQVSEYFGGIMVKFKVYGGDPSVYVVPTGAPEGPELLEGIQLPDSRVDTRHTCSRAPVNSMRRIAKSRRQPAQTFPTCSVP
jgi:hypothetical protein